MPIDAEELTEMIDMAADTLSGVVPNKDPVTYAHAVGQLASAAYLGQIASTLSEMLQMVKDEEAQFKTAYKADLKGV